MKKFYKCKICGVEFCLKGAKYCKETDNVICAGQPSGSHEDTNMDYAGNTIESLRILRKRHKDENNKRGCRKRA